MSKNISRLVFILRDETGCYYFNPDAAWLDRRGWKIGFENTNVPRGQGKKQCVKIAKRRNIVLVESLIVRLDAFDTFCKKGRKQQKVTIRPFFGELAGQLPRVSGLIAYDEEAEFHDRIRLPDRPAKAA